VPDLPFQAKGVIGGSSSTTDGDDGRSRRRQKKAPWRRRSIVGRAIEISAKNGIYCQGTPKLSMLRSRISFHQAGFL